MFNFFDELKRKGDGNIIYDFNIVNISGKMLYAEGHLGLTVMNEKMVAFKIKGGRVVIEGEGLFLSELTDNTMLIKGKIVKMEQF